MRKEKECGTNRRASRQEDLRICTKPPLFLVFEKQKKLTE